MKKKNGFTLIEILAAVVILGILTLVVIISINRINSNAKKQTAIVTFKSIVNSLKNEDILNHQTGDSIEVFSVKEETGKQKLRSLVSNIESLDDGLIAMHGSYLVQANLCINGYSLGYYFDSNDITIDDSEKYCHYTDAYGIDYENIDSENKIAGLKYKNPEYVLYMQNNNNEDIIPSEYVDDDFYVMYKLEKIGVVSSSLSSSNEELPSSYSLKDEGYVTSVKNQGSLNLCWAYAIVGAVESNMLMKNEKTGLLSANEYKNLDLSERIFDYLNAKDGLKFNGKQVKNPYAQTRSLNEGTQDRFATGMLFMGISLYDENDFKNDKKIIMKDVKDVFKINDVKYYATGARLLNYKGKYTDEYLKTIRNNMKEYIMSNGALTVGTYMNHAENFSNNINSKDVLVNNENIGAHGVLIVGWDDEKEYWDKDNVKHKGVWIVKNSWGENKEGKPYNSYFYIGYDEQYSAVYGDDHVSIESVEKRDWNKSYDAYNHAKKKENTYYYDKPNNSSEDIIRIGFFNDSFSPKDEIAYIFEVENESECYYKSDNKNNIKDNNNGTITYYGKIYNGFSYQSDVNYRGFKVYKLDNSFNIKNDVCIIVNNYNRVSFYTKTNTTDKIIESTKVSDSEIRTVTSNIDSGEKIEYEIYDSNDKNVTKYKTIENNFIVNNMARATITTKDDNPYYVKTKIDGTYSKDIIYLNGSGFSNVSCNFEDKNLLFTEKIKINTSKDIYITCSSNVPFKENNVVNVTSSNSNLHINSIKEVNNENNNGTYYVSYSINVTGKSIGFSRLTLKEGSIINTSSAKNKTIESDPIWVKILEPIINGCN